MLTIHTPDLPENGQFASKGAGIVKKQEKKLHETPEMQNTTLISILTFFQNRVILLTTLYLDDGGGGW